MTGSCDQRLNDEIAVAVLAVGGEAKFLSVLLGLDFGTSSARCLALDDEGQPVAQASAEYPLHSPHPGWSEQRPEDWWNASCKVITQVIDKAGHDVRGIGLTGQMHGCVFLDKHDTVIRPALLWNDQRTSTQAKPSRSVLVSHASQKSRAILR